MKRKANIQGSMCGWPGLRDYEMTSGRIAFSEIENRVGESPIFYLLPAHDFAINPGQTKPLAGFFIATGFVKLPILGQIT